MAKELNEDTTLKLSVKTLAGIAVLIFTLVGMWFTLQGEITEAKELPKIDNPDADPAVNTKPGGFGKLAEAVMGARAGGGGADHTHPEFAQLDEGMQKIASGEFSGGVGGGGAETEPWKAMGMDEFKGMDRGARQEYIQGLSPDQKKQQSLEFTAFNDPRKGSQFDVFGNMKPKNPFGDAFARMF